MSYPIPVGALNQHVIALGKTRAGKSSKLRLLVEGLLDDSKPVCVLDPKGDWWGLKSTADGQKAGYPVIIFGGEHADVPINEHSGAHVAELIATGNRPAIIDLGGWMVGARTRFFVDFASTLFKLTRGPRWLVMDECHNFAPQGKVLDPDAGKMLHWANRLASEGSGKGLTLISASQRPQKVHKDYVTSHETLIACRVIHPLDRNAIKDWIDGCADPQVGRDVIGALAGLDRSQAFVWSPEIGFGPELVTFPMFKTYDSFKAQAHDAPAALKGWASVDLEDVKAKLARVVEEAKANDPKALKAEIAKLKAEAAKAGSGVDATTLQAAVDAAEAAGYDRGHDDGGAQVLKALGGIASDLATSVGSAKEACERSERLLASFSTFMETQAADRPRAPTQPAVQARLAPVAAPAAPRPAQPPVARASEANGALSGPQRKVLEALAFWRGLGFAQPTRVQVAAVAGYSPTSGGFANLLGTLRTAGMIDYPASGAVTLKADGEAQAPPPDGRPLLDRVNAILSGPQQKVLAAILEAGEATRDEIAAATEYSATSGGFANLLGSLRSLGLIEYPSRGQVRAEEWLFR